MLETKEMNWIYGEQVPINVSIEVIGKDILSIEAPLTPDFLDCSVALATTIVAVLLLNVAFVLKLELN